jgi:hypothetical protein
MDDTPLPPLRTSNQCTNLTMLFIYPANLAPDEDGGFVVTFRHIPEAIAS